MPIFQDFFRNSGDFGKKEERKLDSKLEDVQDRIFCETIEDTRNVPLTVKMTTRKTRKGGRILEKMGKFVLIDRAEQNDKVEPFLELEKRQLFVPFFNDRGEKHHASKSYNCQE